MAEELWTFDSFGDPCAKALLSVGVALSASAVEEGRWFRVIEAFLQT